MSFKKFFKLFENEDNVNQEADQFMSALIKASGRRLLDARWAEGDGVDIETWLTSYPDIWEGLEPIDVIKIADTVFDKVAYPEGWDEEKNR